MSLSLQSHWFRYFRFVYFQVFEFCVVRVANAKTVDLFTLLLLFSLLMVVSNKLNKSIDYFVVVCQLPLPCRFVISTLQKSVWKHNKKNTHTLISCHTIYFDVHCYSFYVHFYVICCLFLLFLAYVTFVSFMLSLAFSSLHAPGFCSIFFSLPLSLSLYHSSWSSNLPLNWIIATYFNYWNCYYRNYSMDVDKVEIILLLLLCSVFCFACIIPSTYPI